jgi:hypothetical protein
VKSRLVYGLPKNDKDRRVPLPMSIAGVLRALPRGAPSGDRDAAMGRPDCDELVTVPLVFTTPRRNAINRSDFNSKSWHPALRAAGITPTRATGMRTSAPATRGETPMNGAY